MHGEGLYPEAMYDEEPYDDEAIVDGLMKGDLYFATIDSMEAFDIHGGAYAGAIAHAKNPADLEFTAIPRGASLALDAKNHPARESPSFSFREDWVWALPATRARHRRRVPVRAVPVAPEIHARVCEAFGTLPLHPDVVAERVSRFRLEWMSHVFQASLEQAQHGEPVPDALAAKGLGSIYAQLWTTIVARGVPPRLRGRDRCRAPCAAAAARAARRGRDWQCGHRRARTRMPRPRRHRQWPRTGRRTRSSSSRMPAPARVAPRAARRGAASDERRPHPAGPGARPAVGVGRRDRARD